MHSMTYRFTQTYDGNIFPSKKMNRRKQRKGRVLFLPFLCFLLLKKRMNEPSPIQRSTVE
jgi:hypothetical protein